jgi:Uma2 family endonuclease
MKTVVLGDPPAVLVTLIAERKRLGLDTHEELWQGEYHLRPAPSFEHARVGGTLVRLLGPRAEDIGCCMSLEFNLGSPDDFRVPDLGVHRGEPSGVWLATGAIAVEVRSPDDETYDKFDFYFAHGVEEVLVADLASKTVTWFVRSDGIFITNSRSELLGFTRSDVLASLKWSPSRQVYVLVSKDVQVQVLSPAQACDQGEWLLGCSRRLVGLGNC